LYMSFSNIILSLFCRFLSVTSICSLSFLYLLLHFYLVYLPPLIYSLCFWVHVTEHMSLLSISPFSALLPCSYGIF
jgi:hypothetical protein